MSMHRFALGLFFASATSVAATMYGCSDNQAEAPPELDAGNPVRTNDSGGTSSSGGTNDATTDGPVAVTYKAAAAITATGLPNSGTPQGSVNFTEQNGIVTVQVNITGGATPGVHGMHVHDGPTCANSTDPDAGAAGFAQQAGGHWNPNTVMHGFPDAAVHHPGDLGNIVIDGSGAGTLTLAATSFNVQPDGGTLSAVGHVVIFHQGTDDGTSQPTGDAGTRAGCGPIQAQ